MKRAENKTHYLTDGYEVVLDPGTIKLLFEKIRFNLRVEEIVLNCRILAKFLPGKKEALAFDVKPIQVGAIFETEEMKNEVLTKSYQELGMNKYPLVPKRETRRKRIPKNP